MALQLAIAGPGFEASRRIASGEPALILGRDADCAVCLPDPQRNVSRRHLSVWNEGEALQFLVVSVVNGVEVDGAAVAPAARGLLRPGQVLSLADYRITVQASAEAAAGSPDPWAEFEQEAARLVSPVPLAAQAAPEDDPFGDWGFQSTFGPGSPGGSLDAAGLAPGADLEPFFAGLGVAPAARGFTRAELEAMGRLTRIALQGLLQALDGAGGTRQAVRSEDRTLLEPPEANPLRLDIALERKLRYLFGGQAASAGAMAPERAVGEAVGDVLAHQRAMAAAVHQAIEGVLGEFDPEALKARLMPGGAKLFESARAWDAFARDYDERRQDLPAWVRQLLDQHFAAAYARALLRAKRHTADGHGG